jgi:hypothetical protein
VSANLDLVRSIYGDWEHGDFTRVDWVDPEIEYEQADGPSPGKWKGLPAVARPWGDALSAWEDFTQRAEEYRQLDAERVLVLTRVSGRGKRSGLELPERVGARRGSAPYPGGQSDQVGPLLRVRPRPRRPRHYAGGRAGLGEAAANEW